jgi:hypothetical protein
LHHITKAAHAISGYNDVNVNFTLGNDGELLSISTQAVKTTS